MANTSLSLPLFILAGAAAVLLITVRREERAEGAAPAIAMLGLLLAALVLCWVGPDRGETLEAFRGFVFADGLGLVAGIVVALAGLVTVMFLSDYLQRLGRNLPEVHVLLLLCVAGMLIMVMTDHLATLFLGLEIMSLALYALTACLRSRSHSVEAGVKYFLTGAFASGILLMGIAFVYGATGTFRLSEMGTSLVGGEALLLTGLLLMLVGLGFKVALVPFHQWAPDVYEGAPTPLTGFMSTAVKLVAFVAFLRVVEALAPTSGDRLMTVLAWLSVLTMTVGNLGAVVQRSIKRMLAYSSISHAGYILLGLVAIAAGGAGRDAVLFYLVAYTIMNLGMFAVLSSLENEKGTGLTFEDLAGLKQRHPWLAASALVFMLSLAGIPPTSGFLAKWKIFGILSDRLQAASAAGAGDLLEGQGPLFVFLLVALVVNSVIGLSYYLRVIVTMYMAPQPEGVRPAIRIAGASAFGILACGFLVLWLGFGPQVLGVGAEGLVAWVRGAVG